MTNPTNDFEVGDRVEVDSPKPMDPLDGCEGTVVGFQKGGSLLAAEERFVDVDLDEIPESSGFNQNPITCLPERLTKID